MAPGLERNGDKNEVILLQYITNRSIDILMCEDKVSLVNQLVIV